MKYNLQLLQAFRLFPNILGSNSSFQRPSVIVCPVSQNSTTSNESGTISNDKSPKCCIFKTQSTANNDDCKAIDDADDDCTIIYDSRDDDCKIIYDSKDDDSKAIDDPKDKGLEQDN